MSHQALTIWQALVQLLSRFKEDIYLSLIIVVVEYGRFMYFGGKWRKAIGEGLICLVLIHVVRPHIPHIPTVGGFQISSYDIAFIIAMLGVRGIRRTVEWVMHRYTGAKIQID